MIAEYAPNLLNQGHEYLDVNHESLGDFAVALAVSRQADPAAEDRNRTAIATFARLLPNVFDDDEANATHDDYVLNRIVIPALKIPVPTGQTPEDRRHLAVKGRQMPAHREDERSAT